MPTGVAARWAGWAGSHANLPGPLLSSSSAVAGVPFLAGVYGSGARIIVEMAFGADLAADPGSWNWRDITTDVMFNGQVNINPMGRGDETSSSQPSGCSFKLLNNSGDYGKGPASRWYPYVRRNTPVRVSVNLTGQAADTSVRFQGYANGFTPSWDASASVAVVSVSASGILRRLQQGKTPLKSPMRRAVSSLSPLAWWPLEDGSDATQASSGVTGGTPLSVTTAGVVFGKTGDDKPAGATSAVDITTGMLSGTVAGTSTAGWAVSFAFRATQTAQGLIDGSVAYAVGWTAGGYPWIAEIWGAGSGGIPDGVIVAARDPILWANRVAAADVNGTTGTITPTMDGEWHTVVLQATQSGANAVLDLYFDGTFRATHTGVHTLGALSGPAITPEITHIPLVNTELLEISNFALYETTVAPAAVSGATDGYSGETATDRLIRLCDEENVPITVRGTSTTAMGPQGIATFVNVLRECETADDGVLYDGRDPGVTYVARTTRYNATAALTADMSADPPQVAIPFDPVDDDQRNRNLVKVDRPDGSSATFEDSTGAFGTAAIGTYDSSLTLNVEDDSGLLSRAAHEVHKGTVDSPYRYPRLSLNMAATPTLAGQWLDTEVSSRIDVTNVTSKATQHPPGDVELLLEGWGEQLSPFDWTVQAACSAFDPWRVAVIEGTGDTAWLVDSGASTLAANADAGATSITVTVSDGYLWSSSAGDYPRDIDVGGVQVTVTAVAGASSPQTFTVAALAYPLTAGWQVKLWRPPTIAL